MTDNTTTTVPDNTTNAAASDVQADTSFLTTQVTETDEGTDKPSAETNADAATTDATNKDESETEKPEGETEEDEKLEGAPEKYEFVAPEGVTLDPEAVAEFEPIAREMNLTNDQAQKLVGLQASFVQKQHEAWNKQVNTWVGEIKTDKEIGGTALKQTITHSQSALAKFGTPELMKALDSTKMGNHPELVRVFARIGKAMAEDNFVPSEKPSGENESAANRMYGKKS